MLTNGFSKFSFRKNVKHMLMKTTEKNNSIALGLRVQNLQPPCVTKLSLPGYEASRVGAAETISSMASRMAPAHSSPCAKTPNALADSLPRIFIKVVFVALAARCAIPRLCVK